MTYKIFFTASFVTVMEANHSSEGVNNLYILAMNLLRMLPNTAQCNLSRINKSIYTLLFDNFRVSKISLFNMLIRNLSLGGIL